MFGHKFMLAALVVCFGCSNVFADEEAAIELMQSYMLECIEHLHLTEAQVTSLTDDSKNKDYCFASCFFKKMGIFKDNGMFDGENMFKNLSEIVEGEEELEKLNAISKGCKKVNDVKISGGDEDCKRAKIFIECVKSYEYDVIENW